MSTTVKAVLGTALVAVVVLAAYHKNLIPGLKGQKAGA